VITNLMTADVVCTIPSLVRYGATNSSIPIAKGKIVSVTLENAEWMQC
jgi:hypothetical protein